MVENGEKGSKVGNEPYFSGSHGTPWGRGPAQMFLGTHEPRLDEKGRLILPAKFRDELSPGLVITKGQERCLYVFPATEFAHITETLRQAPVTAKAAVITHV